jgi:hypothetical protein
MPLLLRRFLRISWMFTICTSASFIGLGEAPLPHFPTTCDQDITGMENKAPSRARLKADEF